MHNLHGHREPAKKKLVQEVEQKEMYNQATPKQPKQVSKPPINKSSSQTSVGNMNGIVDLGNKKKLSQGVMPPQPHEEKRHETIVVQKQQKTKPLIGKANSSIIKRHETMNSFDEEGSLDPTLTANTIVNNRMQTHASEISTKEELSHLNNIRVEKQNSSSDSDEAEEENDEDSQGDEFPVALNGLVFSFLPPAIAEKLNDQKDWKNRVAGLQETETLIK